MQTVTADPEVIAGAKPARAPRKAVAHRDDQPLVAASIDTSPPAVIARALATGTPVADLKELMAMQERWEANEARKSYSAAFAAFKAEAITVFKGTAIKDGPLKGKFHANLFDVVIASTAALAKHGLSASWKLTKDDPAWMEVTCVLSHIDGHSESVSMGGAPDTGPGRNAIQARGSTKSYLERYTLMGILGLAASDKEDDDAGHGHNLPRITEEQVRILDDTITEIGANKPAFLKYLKVASLSDLPVQAFKDAQAALETKRNAAK
jgi:hypothetical protein